MNFSRDMKNLKNRRKGKAGFTMSELLIVVAIVIVLFAVAVLSLVTIQKNLRQKELDSKAEILYVAAQNRMSELRAGGYESLYQYDENKVNGVAKVGLIPLDAPEEDAEDAITKDTLCYVVSADRVEVGKAAASVLPESSVDAELWNNHWVIEYDPESGSVYGAFYSEEEINAFLKQIFEDFVSLRRYLIEYGFLHRTKDCQFYSMDLGRIREVEDHE